MNYYTLYHHIWIWTALFFCLVVYAKWGHSRSHRLLERKESGGAPAFIYTLVFSVVMGLRPLAKGSWADSHNYARAYYSIDPYSLTMQSDYEGDWLFDLLQKWFVSMGQPVEMLFLFVCIVYMFGMYFSTKRLMPGNQWIGLLFNVTGFSFFSYSFNGIRNGMACSLILLAFSYLVDQKTKLRWVMGLGLCFLAVSIHKSTFLPAVCVLVSIFMKKNLRWSLIWWVFSIVLFFIAGDAIANLFTSLGFDDRVDGYIGTSVEDSEYAELFSHTGFRWDFLLYSVMPILLGYIIVIKRGVRDRVYLTLLNTYILCNSFWIMVITSVNSNRFAYLSWFMYPLILSYPLLRVPIWHNQDRRTAQVLMLHMGFTLFMFLFYD